MKNYSVRTDLALEEKERFASDNVEVRELFWRKSMTRRMRSG